MEAPVQQVVLPGADADLTALPGQLVCYLSRTTRGLTTASTARPRSAPDCGGVHFGDRFDGMYGCCAEQTGKLRMPDRNE
jgi:hypothetical protein